MRKMRLAAVLMFFLSGAAPGAESAGRTGRWVRRVSLAAACAASVWDITTTRTAVSRGAVESNGFLANAVGRPRWGAIIGWKAGVCAASVLGQELPIFRRHESVLSNAAWTGINLGFAARFSAAAIHNREIAGSLSGSPAHPQGRFLVTGR